MTIERECVHISSLLDDREIWFFSGLLDHSEENIHCSGILEHRERIYIFQVYLTIERESVHFSGLLDDREIWFFSCLLDHSEENIHCSGILDHRERIYIFQVYLTIERMCSFF